MKKIVLIILFVIMSQKIAQASGENNFTIVPHPWLETLSVEDQRTALVIYHVALLKKFEEVMLVAKNNTDKMWGLKIMACGHKYAAQTATKNIDQREALIASSLAWHDGIIGNGSPGSRFKAVKDAERGMLGIANSASNKAGDRLKATYFKESNRFNDDLIISAMDCASDGTLKKQSLCKSNGVDVCKLARQAADLVATNLPMRVNSSLTVYSVMAIENSLIYVIVLNYTQEMLNEILTDAGIGKEEMLEKFHGFLENSLCTNSAIRHFTDSGGKINYIYKFSDGRHYTNITTNKCKN